MFNLFKSIKNIFSSKPDVTDVSNAPAAPEMIDSVQVQEGELTPDQAALFEEPMPSPVATQKTSLQMPSRKTQIALAVAAGLGLTAYLLVRHPPVQSVQNGQTALRINQLTGSMQEMSPGQVLVIPNIHQLRVFNLRDQQFRSADMSKSEGSGAVQSIEGLALGVDVMVRFAIDPTQIKLVASRMQSDAGTELVEPALQGVAYKTFAKYTVREIYSSKRGEIAQSMEAELKARLAADGLIFRGVQVGKIDLPRDYSSRMETLLAEELATEKMKYTLDLKEKRVKESELEANAEKVRRQLQAEAAGNEQIIAAKAQEEAMKHVLPFKQRQIEQRKLEAEAQKQASIKTAEGNAEARKIEADGEANARQRLAQAEAFRVKQVGIAGAEQMEREGALLTRHPLLIQKAMADKLSDKVQVIIASPPSDGGFIGSALLGAGKRNEKPVQEQSAQAVAEKSEESQN